MKAQPILVAEDSSNDVLLLKHHLKTKKIINPVQVVEDGEKAICYLKGEGKYSDRQKYPFPVLLFLDLRMPKVGGYEILSMLQSSKEHSNLPVIVLSVFAEVKDMKEAYQRGATSFLVKPIEGNDLIGTLHGIKALKMIEVKQGICLEAN